MDWPPSAVMRRPSQSAPDPTNTRGAKLILCERLARQALSDTVEETMAEPVEVQKVYSNDVIQQLKPGMALRTAWKTTLVNAVSGGLSVVLLILGYLQTVDLSHIVTPQQALMWTLGVNVATIVLRAVATRPIVIDRPPRQGAIDGPATRQLVDPGA